MNEPELPLGNHETLEEDCNKTDFDTFVNQWKDKQPPDEELVKLAQKLCNENDLRAVANRKIDRDECTACHVSWEGFCPEWFTEVFIKTPEMERFTKFGCRMWFLRGYGIKEMLRRRNVLSGCVIDHMEKFVPLVSDRPRKKQRLVFKSQATTFISFTGSYTIDHFAELVRHDDLRGHYLWVDTFCVDQFAWTERKDEEMLEFKKTFMHQLRGWIGRIGYTSLMLERWDDLMSTLGRIWVLWEIFLTADTKAKLHVLLSKSEHQRFLCDGLADEADAEIRSLARIDASRAKASRPEDKAMIMETIQESGVTNVNTLVVDRMREWLVATGTAHLEELRQSGDSSLHLSNNLATIYSDLGMIDKATRMYREVSDHFRSELGDKHPDTLSAIHNLADSLCDQEKFDEAEPLCKEALAGRREQLGADDPDTLASMNVYATLLYDKCRLAEAEPLFREVLAGRSKRLGQNHPGTMTTVNSLAILLSDKGELVKAESLYRRAILGFKISLVTNIPIHWRAYKTWQSYSMTKRSLKRPSNTTKFH